MFNSKKYLALGLTLSMLMFTGCSSKEISNTSNSINKPTESISNSNSSVSNPTENTLSTNSKDKANASSSTSNTAESIASVSPSNLHFIDTGNSDAILIENSGKFALIDGGDTDDDATVVNYLKEQGVSELEYLIATHPHADHIGGLDSVVNSFKVNTALVSNGEATSKTYNEFISAMSNKGVYPSVPLLGSKFKLGSSTFEVLSVANTSDPNNNSIVLLYRNGNDKVLLMGDAEISIERNLTNIGKVDLLKVGHHGSDTSTSRSFLDSISPNYAVIMVGKNNKYAHPSEDTMNKLCDNFIEVHRTDECGTIVFKSTGNGLETQCTAGSYDAPKYKGLSERDEDIQTNISNSNSSNNINSSNNSNTSSNSDTSSNKAELNYVQSVGSGSSSSSSSSHTGGGTVYWTTEGKKYHFNPNCSRMKNPSSGTIEQSGRSGCKKCT